MSFDPRLLTLPDGPLHGKLTRAEELFGDLYRETGQWVAAQEQYIVRERRHSSLDVWTLVDIDPPPLRLSILVGDILNNARSALDHTAFDLCSGQKLALSQQWRIEFPICRKGSDFDAQRVRYVRNMARPGGVRLLEEVQPFKRGRRWHQLDLGRPTKFDPTKNPLVWLKELVNIDKHRYLHLAVGGVSGFGIGWPPGVEGSHWFKGTGPIEPGDDLLRVHYCQVPPVDGGIGDPSLRLDAFLATPVVANTGLPLSRLPVLGMMRLILAATREAIHHVSGGHTASPLGILSNRSA